VTGAGRGRDALGAVLAGGRGSRLGGRKAEAEVAGRPLLSWTVDLLRRVAGEVVVIAKPFTPLPETDAPVLRSEPADFHPRHGIVSALRHAEGRPTLVVPVDMPLVPVALLHELLDRLDEGAPAAIPESDGYLQPLCAAYGPKALEALEAAPEDEPLKRTIEQLDPAVIPADAYGERMLNVNQPSDLLAAELGLGSRQLVAHAWEAAAEDWIRWARTPYHDHYYWRFVLPHLREILPPPGELTVDVGCGEGRLARELIVGGHTVVGIEASPTLAAAARAGDPAVDVVVADAAALPLADGVADLVVASMSLLDLDDLEGAIAEAGRVLAPGGRLCFATAHPLATYAAVRDLLGARSYFGEATYAETIERDGLKMAFTSVHRPLSALTGALARAGLLVELLREPVPGAAHVAEHPDIARWRTEPFLLVGRAVAAR
jgi:molybdopterin-guanine dinucleotide biosynthesis protein A/SAM-dependent methyltransferase